MAKARFVALTDDRGLARRFWDAVRGIEPDLREAVRETGEDAEVIFAAHALRDTGRMSRGIRSNVYGSTAIVTATAKDPETGYDYVGVTRFGHRRERIYPVRKMALRLPWGFYSSVRGFKPPDDWAERGLPEIRAAAQQNLAKVGRGFMVRVSG